MFSLTDSLFWGYFIYFFIAIFFAFYIPGMVVLHRSSLSSFQSFVLGTITGMVMWALQGFLFGFLHIRWLTYGYLLVLFILWTIFCFRKNRRVFLGKINFKKVDWLIFVLIAIGTLMQVTVVWFSGFRYSDGLYMCCGNPSDGLYHIALTQQLVKNIPPFEPGMSGIVVHNYHYLSNIVVAELIRVFRLPLIPTQFQYSTVFISLFLGLTVLVFGQILKVGRVFTLWLLFFLYMGGDWMYLILLGLGKGINFNMSGIENGMTFLINPPRAFSIVIFFAALSLLLIWLKKKDLQTGLVMAMLFGSLVGFKVYTGIFALIGLVALGIYFIFSKKISLLMPLCITVFLTIAIYTPVNAGAGGLYFIGWGLFEDFMVQKYLGLERLVLAKRIYEDHHSVLRVLQYELGFMFLYIFGIFGSKLLALFQIRKSFSKLPHEIHIFFIPAFIISMIAGLFFQQTSGGANTFNFLVSVFIFGSVYAALTISYWSSRFPKKIGLIISMLVILLTIPRVAYEWSVAVVNLYHHQGFIINNYELGAAKYLRNNTNPNSLILVDHRQFLMEKGTPYLSIFADRPMFLSGQDILESHGVDTSSRVKVFESIIRGTNAKEIISVLKQNRIDYIYLAAEDTLPIEASHAAIPVFMNKEVMILKTVR